MEHGLELIIPDPGNIWKSDFNNSVLQLILYEPRFRMNQSQVGNIWKLEIYNFLISWKYWKLDFSNFLISWKYWKLDFSNFILSWKYWKSQISNFLLSWKYMDIGFSIFPHNVENLFYRRSGRAAGGRERLPSSQNANG